MFDKNGRELRVGNYIDFLFLNVEQVIGKILEDEGGGYALVKYINQPNTATWTMNLRNVVKFDDEEALVYVLRNDR